MVFEFDLVKYFFTLIDCLMQIVAIEKKVILSIQNIRCSDGAW